MLVVGFGVIRVEGLARETAFWTADVGYGGSAPGGAAYALLHPEPGAGVSVSLDAVAAPRVLPPRIHLDLYAQDQDAEVTRLERLGARRVVWDRQPADADYVIMEDPEGNRFCVVDAAEWSGWAGAASAVASAAE
ncbi:VOC family protein [Microbacterium hominis]|uniref:VOC family protein n=1 Tax=Microbacterium hominis TaxID=162426 RepID=UPI0007689196|nr:VOC family protein [Microbacterium hominis]KXC07438.1 hypothetical protein MhomT_00090 [Microbacterium hominis]